MCWAEAWGRCESCMKVILLLLLVQNKVKSPCPWEKKTSLHYLNLLFIQQQQKTLFITLLLQNSFRWESWWCYQICSQKKSFGKHVIFYKLWTFSATEHYHFSRHFYQLKDSIQLLYYSMVLVHKETRYLLYNKYVTLANLLLLKESCLKSQRKNRNRSVIILIFITSVKNKRAYVLSLSLLHSQVTYSGTDTEMANYFTSDEQLYPPGR